MLDAAAPEHGKRKQDARDAVGRYDVWMGRDCSPV